MIRKGSLMVVGSGIKSIGHLTLEAQGWIEQADVVLYCVADPATALWIKRANPHAVDLAVFYGDDKPRLETYRQMVAEILRHVRAGLDVCAVFYGHPGVFVRPSHEAIRVARAEGYTAGMLPAVSALDCLFADLNIDPAEAGCQVVEATDILVRRRRLCPDCHVVVFQIALVGDPGHDSAGYSARNLPALVRALQRTYGPTYEVVHYQAARYPADPPLIERLALSRLRPGLVTGASTLYIPPAVRPRRDVAVEARLRRAAGRARRAIVAQVPPSAVMKAAPATAIAARDSRLVSLIADLSCNPRLLAHYVRDPQAALARYGVLADPRWEAALHGHNDNGRTDRVDVAAATVTLAQHEEVAHG